MDYNNNIPTSSRRNVLKSVPAAGVFLTFGGIATGRSARAEDSNDNQLGEFSDGLDGWRTTGGNGLTRVGEDEIPAAVRVGTHALGVEVNGDLHPMIENKKRVREADFVDHPYLLAHVLGYAEETDSDMVFRFRLLHTDTSADGQGSGNGGGGNDLIVEESDEQQVAQLDPHHLRWDLRDLDKDVLETANRLEIVWYLEDHEPERGHRGRARGKFDYRGLVTFDDIRVTDDAAEAEARASQAKRQALHRAHGMVVERTFEERAEDVERGTLVFVDGTEVSYSFEVLGDDRFRYMIDGETFEFGGESS